MMSIDPELIDFSTIKEIETKNYYKAYSWGDYIIGKWGSTWRIYNKYGVPLTPRAHEMKLSGFGLIELTLGAGKTMIDFDEIQNQDILLEERIHKIINDRLSKMKFDIKVNTL